MNVSVYLLDAALSGDDLARKQVNDILEEYKLNKIPEINFNWKINKWHAYTRILGYAITVYQRFDKEENVKWLVKMNGKYENIPYDTKEEGMRAAERLFMKKLYK